ncbi:MAG: hypothetical protein ACE5HO_15235 [bacterium]
MSTFKRIRKPNLMACARKLLRFLSILLLTVFVLLGGWCLPPTMVEKVVQSLKQKFTTEYVLKKDENKKS